jgi:hypothetical protein
MGESHPQTLPTQREKKNEGTHRKSPTGSRSASNPSDAEYKSTSELSSSDSKSSGHNCGLSASCTWRTPHYTYTRHRPGHRPRTDITHICCAQLYFSLNFILNTPLPACRHTQVGCQQTSSQHYQLGSFTPARPWPGPAGGAVSWEAADCSHAESCRRPHACHVQLYSN